MTATGPAAAVTGACSGTGTAARSREDGMRSNESVRSRPVRQQRRRADAGDARAGDRRPRRVGADPGGGCEPARRQDHGRGVQARPALQAAVRARQRPGRGRRASGPGGATVRAGRGGLRASGQGPHRHLRRADRGRRGRSGAQAGRADDGGGGVAAAGRAHRLAGAGGAGEPAARPEGPHPCGIRRRGDDRDPVGQAPRRATSPRPPAPPTSTGSRTSARTSSSTTVARTSSRCCATSTSSWTPSAARPREVAAGARPGGMAIGIGGPPDPDFAAQLGQGRCCARCWPLLSRRTRRGPGERRCGTRSCSCGPAATSCAQITALVDAGTIRPVIDRVFAFDDTMAALDYVETGRAKGKVVVTMADLPLAHPIMPAYRPHARQHSRKSHPQKGTAMINEQETRHHVVTSYTGRTDPHHRRRRSDFRLPRARPEDRGPGDLPHPPGRGPGQLGPPGRRRHRRATPRSSPSTTGASALPPARRRTPSRRWPRTRSPSSVRWASTRSTSSASPWAA